ncbi:MAG: hypothetical protein EBX19_09275 [Actinobacteria bacterium]|nr:hypothetical protein [Actinomycetota bacterium]
MKHRRAHHQLGFTGNVLTLNKAWGSSLKRAREARIALYLKTFWIVIHVITCIFIMANTIRHW